MYFQDSLPFISDFIHQVGTKLGEKHSQSLSSQQEEWISFCMMGILSSKQVNWRENERNSLSLYKDKAQSWMFRHSKILWDELFQEAVRETLSKFNITKGSLQIDDVDRARSKSTTCLHLVHYLKDKKSGGTVPGQCLVFLFLVTPVISIPVGFDFYMPDPERTKWKKEDFILKKSGVPKRERPLEPTRREQYPKKQEIALKLLQQFQKNFPEIRVTSVNADALYGEADFMNESSLLFPQVVSQIRKDQKILFRGKEKSIEKYMSSMMPTEVEISIRGKKQKITFISARLHLVAHHKKRFIIALKYEGESEFRYLVATDMTWRTHDILQSYFLRWLVEVFFEDWKGHEGWGALAKHTGEEGSRRGLILSLVFDLCLLHYPDQKASLQQQLPAYTVASITRKARIEGLIHLIQKQFQVSDSDEKVTELNQSISNIFHLKTSTKHFSGRKFPKLEPSPYLKYRKAG